MQFSCNCNYSLITHNKTPVHWTWGLLRVCAACSTPRLNLSSELRPSWNNIQDTFPTRSAPDTTTVLNVIYNVLGIHLFIIFRVKTCRWTYIKEFFILSDAFFFVGVYFGQSSLHNVPTNKASLYKFLRDGNIMFRIYCRTLHQRMPTQVGEAHLSMTDILKSETSSLCKDVEVVCRTKIPESQVVTGLLKVTVKLGARRKYIDSDFPDKLNKEFLSSNAGGNCESGKRDSEANLRHLSDPTPAPRSEGFNISRGIYKNSRKKVMSCDVSKEREFCKNVQQEIELDDKLAHPSLREVCVNKVRHPVLLHFVIETKSLVL